MLLPVTGHKQLKRPDLSPFPSPDPQADPGREGRTSQQERRARKEEKLCAGPATPYKKGEEEGRQARLLLSTFVPRKKDRDPMTD
ncbi:hypothetical protein PR202_gb22790 [Eleusine coracana subsp. coracana]|uniref:Uncharacterized protein n=1 Tax=Eleusine coracana subsp. coracana TaxID=191504 RepID=A0AAV5FHH2_ELECO|nr:hypothetical protein PR202_gb22790 [Eleusine coracana subsp. coracana]